MTNLIYSQSFNYRWIESTGEITSFEKQIFKFYKMYNYDMDFKERGGTHNVKYSISIEKVRDFLGPGTLITKWDNKKSQFDIISCYKMTYNDSSDEYYKFKCRNVNGAILYFHLDSNGSNGWKFWIKTDNNERMYFIQF